ncbi:MAG: rubrerythrin family protein [Planctomycetia bacterium]|nr:rubrerythrin family protein [Planctomycetia bacterium]
MTCGCNCAKPADDKAVVIENLQHAFNGESNASAKYAIYAEKARSDGYLAVAALFTAASEAEKLHASRHAAVLKSAGVEAKAEIGTYAGKDIQEMLKDAIAGETEEFTDMYPGFIKNAEACGFTAALASFRGAMEAEKVHAKLYEEALNNLEAWKAERSFYVCPVCGWTEAGAAPEKCPICGVPASKFVEYK